MQFFFLFSDGVTACPKGLEGILSIELLLGVGWIDLVSGSGGKREKEGL